MTQTIGNSTVKGSCASGNLHRLEGQTESLLAPAASSFTKNYKGATETLKALRKYNL